MELKNKVVIITGGTKGLGKALAISFLKENSKVVVCARNKNELKKLPNKILGIKADVTKENEIKNLAKKIAIKFGKIDIWTNNTGITLPHSEIEEIDLKKAHNVFEVNFFGTFYGSREALKIMKKQKHGTILNIISMSALVGRPRSAIYASSKWATRGFNESLRMALKPHNISVLAVHPGGMKTTIFGKFKPIGYENWMEPSYVANKIIQNLKRKKPKEELIIEK